LLKIPTSELLVVEDSVSGISSAKAAGSNICHFHFEHSRCEVDHQQFPAQNIENPNHPIWNSSI
jgi:beta-phosphoglucomutase-like phosphatase (HAD superfamily)